MNPLDVDRLAAAANGVEADQIVVIQDTNNVVVWLQPSAIIAKVGRCLHSAPALLREHAVARQLAGFGAPVAVPVGSPYTEPATSMVATLWDRIDSTSDPEGADPAALAACLASVHAALSDVEVELPDFRRGLDLAARRLFDDNAVDSDSFVQGSTTSRRRFGRFTASPTPATSSFPVPMYSSPISRPSARDRSSGIWRRCRRPLPHSSTGSIVNSSRHSGSSTASASPHGAGTVRRSPCTPRANTISMSCALPRQRTERMCNRC